MDFKIYFPREFAEFHLENAIGEELHGIPTEVEARGVFQFQITRHQAKWNMKEAREWIEEMTEEKEYHGILINEPTIGFRMLQINYSTLKIT